MFQRLQEQESQKGKKCFVVLNPSLSDAFFLSAVMKVHINKRTIFNTDHFISFLLYSKDKNSFDFFESMGSDYDEKTLYDVKIPNGVSLDDLANQQVIRLVGEFSLSVEELKKYLNDTTSNFNGTIVPNNIKLQAAEEIVKQNMLYLHIDYKKPESEKWSKLRIVAPPTQFARLTSECSTQCTLL